MASQEDPFKDLAGIPSAAATVTILAEAMRLMKPPLSGRRIAHVHPVAADECIEVLKLYTGITDQLVRQALLDVMVSISVGK